MRKLLTGLLALSLSVGLVLAADQKQDLDAIKKEYKDKLKDAIADFRKATTEADRTAVLDKMADYFVNALKLEGKDAKEAPKWVIGELRRMPSTKKIAGIYQQLYDKSTDKAVQAQAGIAIAKNLSEEAEGKESKVAQELNDKAEKMLDKIVKDFGDIKNEDGDSVAQEAKDILFEMRNLGIGKTAPEVVSKDLKGNEVKLSALKGKVVVLDIWATWCPPCRAMIPHERELVERLKDKPFALVSISADKDLKTLTDFIEKEPMPWTHWHNGANGGILKDWNIKAFPTIFVLDAKGVIRFKGTRGKEMDKAVDTLLKEIPAK